MTTSSPFASKGSSKPTPLSVSAAPSVSEIDHTTHKDLEPLRQAMKHFRATGVLQRVHDFPISKEMAEELLKIAGANRNIVASHVKKLVSDMTEARWTKRIDPLIIDYKGNLRGGQHTLNAIVESDTIQSLDFVIGLDEAAVRTAGDGIGWKPQDYIGHEIDDPMLKLQVARLMLNYKPGKGLRRAPLSNAELQAYVRTHDVELAEDIVAASHPKPLRNMPRAHMVFAYKCIIDACKELGHPDHVVRPKAREYIQELYGETASGLVDTTSASYKVRDIISSADQGRYAKKLCGNKMEAQNNRLSLIFDGWNRWLVGENDPRMTLRRKFVEPSM